jgi:hypothetical protein
VAAGDTITSEKFDETGDAVRKNAFRYQSCTSPEGNNNWFFHQHSAFSLGTMHKVFSSPLSSSRCSIPTVCSLGTDHRTVTSSENWTEIAQRGPSGLDLSLLTDHELQHRKPTKWTGRNPLRPHSGSYWTLPSLRVPTPPSNPHLVRD